MRAVGSVLWVEEEDDINKIAVISGSGPAYVFYVMECLQKAAEKIGLTPENARILTVETVYGAALLAKNSHTQAAILRANVTSKGGATERAIAVLEQNQLDNIIEEAVGAGLARARELAT